MLVVVFTLLVSAEPEEAAPVDNCSWCTCKNDLENAAISGKRCRPPDWSCFDDPCSSCAGLAWAPVRFWVAYMLLPVCLSKPNWTGEPDCGDIAVFMFFGLPLKECPRPNIPIDPQERPPTQEPVDEPPISVMLF